MAQGSDSERWGAAADEAMERGDHASAARVLAALSERADELSESDAERVRGYQEVLTPDPLATWMVVVGAVGLLAILLLLYVR